MRLFVGLPIPEEVAERAEDLIERLRPAARGLRWCPRASLHITTKFIGSWPGERLDELVRGLGPVAQPRFEVGLGGVGWFPNPHAPRILWAAVSRGRGELARLARGTDEATAALGIAREDKEFSPHMTLARVKPGTDLRALRGAIALLETPELGHWRAEEFCLYRSEAGPAGSVYTKLAGFSLV